MSTLTTMAIVAVYTMSTAGADTTVQQAYKLRMHGDANAAHEILELAAAKDPGNAVVWYELARTKSHIGLGDPRSMVKGIRNIQKTICRAAELEPDNLIYAIWKAKSCGTGAYIALKQQAPDAKEKIQEFVSAYEHVLKLKPDYYEAKLALVEYLNMLPAEHGGDTAKAEAYARELEKAHPVYGAQAREMLLPRDTDYVVFWQEILKQHPDNADVLDRLGKACFYAQKPAQGIKHLRKAIQLDAGKTTLHLDIARYYMYQAMRDQEKLKELAPKMDEAFEAYINSKPTPPNPMLAYAKGWQGQIKSRSGDKEGGDKLREEARALDPNYSKATGIPDQNLFIPPDQVPRGFVYFTRPF